MVILPIYYLGSSKLQRWKMSGILNVAYAFGKPVVVSDVGGIDEEIEDGKTGMLVPPIDPQKLADAIIRLLTDLDLRIMMERNVKIKAEELSRDNIAKETMEIYTEVSITNSKLSSFDRLENS